MTAVFAALAGVVVGIVANRFVSYLGRVLCEASGWDLKETLVGDWEYVFDLDLFNGRDMPTGLRDITVVLICKDGELVSEPANRASWDVNYRGIPSYQEEIEIRVINLPPRQWVRKELVGRFAPKEGVTVSEWQRAELVGEWPSRWRKAFRKKIAER